MALPVNIDTTYPDDPDQPSRKIHQQHHDSLHGFYNLFEGKTPGAANGVATLGADGLVPAAQLPPSGSSGGGVLAGVQHLLASDVSTTSSTGTDLDATNLAVTFTVPASGSVWVELEAFGHSGGNNTLDFLLREGASAVAGTERAASYGSTSSTPERFHITLLVTGLTPAASHTWKFAIRRSFGTGTPVIQGSHYVTMVVMSGN